LFVALELPGDVRERLVTWGEGVIARVPGVRAVRGESLHVTLCFLGWVDVDAVDSVADACAVVSGMPGASLRVGRGIWLPPRRPRVLAVELTDVGGRLEAVQSALSQALAAGGWYKPEKRPFLAHVTVGRVGKGARVRGSFELSDAPDDLVFSGSRVTLFRSRLSPAGARYEGLASLETSTAQ